MRKNFLIALFFLNLLMVSTVFAHQSYVVPTYSNGAIVPVLQAELNQGDGGQVSYYQGKLIIHATVKDYARIQSLLAQIDTAPSPIVLSVFVGENVADQSQSANIGIGIDSRVRVGGSVSYQSHASQTQNHYQVRGTMGLPMSIGKSTLLQLSGLGVVSFFGGVQFRFVNTSWATLSDGFSATAMPLPDGQLQLVLTQSYKGQHLATTLTAQAGEWVKIGEISQSNYSNGGQSFLVMPIWVKVD